MEQATGVHEWVENSSDFDFEGVLICKNSIGSWDEDAVLRAFQTFQWSSATTQGNDSSFSHIGTGVVVRFDGGALAVECGQGRLADALPDLFDVLYSLNWRKAELYHQGPAAVANAFLNDLGRAIPARFHDFDIYLAKIVRPVSEFAESAALVARGKQLLGGGNTEEESVTLLSEMNALNVRAMGSVAASPNVPVSQAGGIQLVDDNDDSSDEVLIVRGGGAISVVAASAPAISAPQPSYLDDDETPRLYDLPVEGKHLGDEDIGLLGQQQLEPQLQQQPQDQQLALRSDLTEGQVPRVMSLDAVDVTEAKMSTSQKPTVSITRSAPMPEKSIPAPGALNYSFAVDVVGRSAFCFDMPEDSLTDDDVLAVADELGIGNKDVVHIHPGALGESVRWDVLGEIVPAYPFFVEKLVVEMFGESDNSPLIASLILALKQRNPCVQLRDLLVFANQGQRDMADALKNVSGEAEMLANRLSSSGDLAPSMSAVMGRLGALALAPAGQAVVDLLPENDEGGAVRGFTVMGIAQSSAARLYVVHVDQLDGPFVLWIVGLLRFVAANYAATKRYTCVDEDAVDIGEVVVEPPTQMEAIVAVATEMTAALNKLVRMGVKF